MSILRNGFQEQLSSSTTHARGGMEKIPTKRVSKMYVYVEQAAHKDVWLPTIK